jgi:hypothetical protein
LLRQRFDKPHGRFRLLLRHRPHDERDLGDGPAVGGVVSEPLEEIAHRDAEPGGEWLDKAAIAGIATFITLGVLVIPASVGAWKQKKLLQEMREEIDAFFRNEATVPKCPECNAENAMAAKFRNACGSP